MNTPLNAFVFGGCLTRLPVKASPLAAQKLRMRQYGVKSVMHSMGEMIQLIEVLRQTRTLSAELRRIGRMPDPRGKANVAFKELDVAIVEPASTIEIAFRGLALNRNLLKEYILDVIGQKRKMASKVFGSWLRVGIVGMDEEIRAETAERLLSMIPEGSEQAELACDLVRETRGSQRDMLSGFRKMQELLPCPIGAVIYTFRYMPDGRPIAWPATLRSDVVDAARTLDIPIFDPVSLVQDYGVANALAPDQGHYNDEFRVLMGDALVRFMESVHAGTRFTAPVDPDKRYSLEDFQKVSQAAGA
jgi:hypothetical protein